MFKKRFFCWACQILASIAVAMLIFGNAYGEPLKTVLKPASISLELDNSRVIRLDGAINPISAAQIISTLRDLDDGKPAYLIISSPGGSVFAGLDIIKQIDLMKYPLTCVVDKYAASMAALVSASCPTLMAHKYAVFMFHEYAGAMQDSRKEMRSQLQLAEAVWNAICKDMSKRMNMSEAEFRRRSGEDWWFNGYEAARMGFSRAVVDKIHIKYSVTDKLFKKVFGVF